jgi:hypothetical protein
MTRLQTTLTALLAGVLAGAPVALAQNENQGQGIATVTVMPKKDKGTAPRVTARQVKAEVNGKAADISDFIPARSGNAPVELVLMIDAGARTSLGREWSDIQDFVRKLPPNVNFGMAYMENGRAAMAGPLTTDRNKALQELHLPMGVPGESASPYFCLSDLAKRWPSNDPKARREVVMITDGVDYYHLQYDPEDPYVHAAISDSVKARMVVYSIYWRNSGRFDRTWYANDSGQNLLQQVTQETGGNSYWQGMGNPVSFQPYFEDLNRRLENQYELSFTAPLKNKAEVQTLKVKVSAPDTKISSPQRVYVSPANAGGGEQ